MIQLKTSSKAEKRTYIVNSPDQMDGMLKDKTKVAQIANGPGKKRMKTITEQTRGLGRAEVEMLALVDSGSTVNAADIPERFAEFKDHIVESRAQPHGETATTAGGHQLLNEGRCRVEAPVYGHDSPIPFRHTKVDVPIISLRKYTKNGFGIHFTDSGKYLINHLNGRTIHFIEHDNAYWMKIKDGKPKGSVKSSPVFSRPGP